MPDGVSCHGNERQEGEMTQHGQWVMGVLFGAALCVGGCASESVEASKPGGDVAGSDVTNPEDGTPPGDDVHIEEDTADTATPDDVVEPPTGPFSVRGTLEQIYVWNVPANTAIEVLDTGGALVFEGETDELGSRVIRELEPGDGYVVRLADAHDTRVADITVTSPEDGPPSNEFYGAQQLVPGYQYITTRDGTKLSAYVSLPGPLEDGPYPTIVNYSGYSPSQPGKSLGGAAEAFCGDFPVLCDAPSHPSGLLGGVMGYASVGVNMRGTGCSGGAYDYFEPLQLSDGYDVIEVVSRQAWVKHNKVGMAGLSYPGISQLFVARTRPPGLAAITPLSVIADSASSTLAPGGIFNDGFALAWIKNVLDRAKPYGHKWIKNLVDAGDTQCEEHQLLHGQMVDVVEKALANPYYTDEVAGPVDPSSWAHEIEVPVFMAGQWQDEQTGPHFATLMDKFTGTDVARFTVTNGVHSDGYTPQVLIEWKTFLDLYVAREIPKLDPLIKTLVPLFFAQSLGAALDIPNTRFEDYTSYEQARADYEAEPPLRVIFETGAALAEYPGAPQGTFEQHFDAWPAPETVAQRWYFQPDGSLGAEAPLEDAGFSASRFNHDPEAGLRTTLTKGGVGELQPEYNYIPLIEGHAMAFETATLEDTVFMMGSGSIDVFLRSNDTEADLEVNLTEVRADGKEIYVQSGWLRASHRALRDDATELRPVKTHLEKDAQPLVPGEWTEVRIELMPFGHIFRAGSRIRVSIDTPGDSRAEWFFILTDQDDSVEHTIGHDAAHPSSIALPIIPTVDVPTEEPTLCTALRGQPCRDYLPLTNSPATESGE